MTNVVELVGKGDLERVKGVLGVLHQLRLCWRDLEGLVGPQHAGFAVLLEHRFSHISMVRAAHEDVLVGKVMEALALHQEFWRIRDLEVRIAVMPRLSGAGHHR